MHATIQPPSHFYPLQVFSFGCLELFKLQWGLKKNKNKNPHLKRGKKKMFYKKIGKSIVRMLKTAYVPTVLAVTHRTFWTTRSLHDQEGSHWVHEKEVTQTEIHKGQHEWDRISAYSSFYMARLLYRKKKPQPTKNPTLLPPLPFSFWNSSVEKLQYGFSIRIPASYLQAFYLYKTPSIILPETLRRIANFSVNYKQFPLFFFLKTACFLEIFIYKCTTQHSMMQSMERS